MNSYSFLLDNARSAIEDAKREIESRLREYEETRRQDGEYFAMPSTHAVLLAARFIRTFRISGDTVTFAFGADGSIGVHARLNDRIEYVDLLPDGRVRYYLKNGEDQRHELMQPDNVESFLHARLVSSMLFSMSIGTIPESIDAVFPTTDYAKSFTLGMIVGAHRSSTLTAFR